jgi:hypothetical protein
VNKIRNQYFSNNVAVLEGANPSAEGEDADEGGEEGSSETVLDLADQFRYAKMEGGLTKKLYQADLKSMSLSSCMRSRLMSFRVHEGPR